MKKAKLAFAAAILSCILTNSAARAADDSTIAAPSTDLVIQHNLAESEPEVNSDSPLTAPMASQAQAALGGMMQLGDILIGDMPEHGKAAPQNSEEQVALGGVPDAPLMEGQSGTGPSSTDKAEAGMNPRIMAMGGCPAMMRFHHRCPLSGLEGPNALTDDQCQKLYEIKGQFISTIVPKGLNVYVLIRKMGDLLTASDPDMKAVRDTERQISSATSDLSTTVMDSLISVDQVLTPAQRQELHRQLVRAAVGAGSRPHHEEPHADK